ncbi:MULTISPECIES: metallophosphoesterase [Mesorhizobium]|uniref:metallophosphoesterase n=1 Tax=Mesorhizobium TaxID=68287 RepID=UPI000AFC8C9D|nr:MULTISPECIES: metallophosphoesterase [Mesorhizobium]MDF3208357.1 metallophosphoesterase [Mesorhizobium sp. LMG15046]MDF3229071.1 metallophosphoesterase [Mesorhizobium sp. DSM 30133]
MKTYAIADLHGRFDLLQMAYDAISQHALGIPGTIVHLGDYVDRGPQSREIIEWLMDDPALPPGWRRICLRGNHEDIMVECCANLELVGRWWIPNGGGRTLISYGAKIGDGAAVAAALVPSSHLDWMKALPRMHIDEHRVFVHAGVDPFKPLDQQDDQDLGWKIYPDDDERGHGKRHVVHGHHQFEDGPILLKGRSDLDTFAWFTGRLVVGVFDDAVAGGPIELLTVQGSHIQDIVRAAS